MTALTHREMETKMCLQEAHSAHEHPFYFPTEDEKLATTIKLNLPSGISGIALINTLKSVLGLNDY